MRIRLRTSSGRYVTSGRASADVPLNATIAVAGDTEEFWLTTPTSRVRSGDRGRLQTNALRGGGAILEEPEQDRFVTTVDSRGRHGERLFARPDHFFAETGDDFEITRLDNDGHPVADGDRIALRFVETGRPGFLTDSGAGLRIVAASDTPPTRQQVFTVETMSDLRLFWSAARADNFSTATPRGAADALSAGYAAVRTQGRVFMNPGDGRVPLYLFWHGDRADNMLVATDEGIRDAVAEGYRRVRLEGFVVARPARGTAPLRTYFKAGDRNDSFAATTRPEERDAADAGYRYFREEGFLLPARAAAGDARASERLGEIRLPRDELVRIAGPRRARESGKKALVLSGGGAKGCFEAGAVEHLWEQGYRPDIICGVSVGALNAAKLAERQEDSARELRAIWQQLDAGGRAGGAVYSKDYFVDLMEHWLKRMLFDAGDDAVGGTDIEDWIAYAAGHVHAVHSMHPLRELVRQNLDVTAIRTSGTQLRIGITDLRTGQYFSVTEPFETGALGLEASGRVEVEPDHRFADNWLTRPILAADVYAMSIQDAIYASCTMPVFMDPKILNLRHTQLLVNGVERVALLKANPSTLTSSTYSPPAIERIMRITRNGTRRFDEGMYSELKGSPQYDRDGMQRDGFGVAVGDSRLAQHHLFDGGLRDTMAIRTAIRLGAREIIVITGDRLQSTLWDFDNPGTRREKLPADLGATPAAQYMRGLLSIWSNEAARTDVLLSVAHNEYLGWLYRCYSLLDERGREQILREFNDYWASNGATLRDVLGGSSWLGGAASRDYGVPFEDEGCSISYIAPPSDLVDALDFGNRQAIEEGIALGREAAKSPVTLSHPIPESVLASIAERERRRPRP